MLKSVQLNVQHGFNAKEIQNVRGKRMLPPEFVSGKMAIAKSFPK